MSVEDKDPERGAEDDRRTLLVDRDVDSDESFVDRDDEDGYLSVLDGSDDWDSDYSASAAQSDADQSDADLADTDEFDTDEIDDTDQTDDPLADWPWPGSEQEDRPQVRAPDLADDDTYIDEETWETAEGSLRKTEGSTTPDQDIAPAPPPPTAPSVSSEPPFDDPVQELGYFSDEVEEAGEAEDTDEAADKEAQARYFEELQFEDEVGEERNDNYNDEFVDDFLNDLDPPDDDGFADEDRGVFDQTPPVADAVAATTSVQKLALGNGAERGDMDTDRTAASAKRALEGIPGRSLPVGMILFVIIAVVLLGVGAYGVVQQRADMQAQIRDLQARLATSVAPDKVEAQRELQRQIELDNASLSAELEALALENSELDAQLAQLQTEISDREAAARASAKAAADEQAAARRRAEQAAAEKARAAASATNAAITALSGPWFVNFGSYAERSFADRWAEKLSVEAGEVVVNSASVANKTLYRVRVVGLRDQSSAERIAAALEQQYQLPKLWIGKN